MVSSEDRRCVERFEPLNHPSGAVLGFTRRLSMDEEGDMMLAAFMTGQLRICAARRRGRSCGAGESGWPSRRAIGLWSRRGCCIRRRRRWSPSRFARTRSSSPRFDKVQVKYEMLRAHVIDGQTATAAAQAHGYSRAAFYLVAAAFERSGMVGLLDERPAGAVR